MSLTRGQIILLKNAQRDAGLDDADYRDALATISAMPDCRSSKDRRLTDAHLDKLLKWFEAIYWNQPERKPSKVFIRPNHWRDKNPLRGPSSRDRFAGGELDAAINQLEAQLVALGFSPNYCAAIRRNTLDDRDYHAALQRTLKSKQRKAEHVPF